MSLVHRKEDAHNEIKKKMDTSLYADFGICVAGGM